MTATNQIIEIYRSVTRTEEMVKSLKDQADKRDEREIETESRLRRVENRQYWWSGAGSALGVLLGLIAGHKL